MSTKTKLSNILAEDVDKGVFMGKRIISLEVSDNLKEALRVAAFHQKVTVSALIRQILETNLDVEAPIKLPQERK